MVGAGSMVHSACAGSQVVVMPPVCSQPAHKPTTSNAPLLSLSQPANCHLFLIVCLRWCRCCAIGTRCLSAAFHNPTPLAANLNPLIHVSGSLCPSLQTASFTWTTPSSPPPSLSPLRTSGSRAAQRAAWVELSSTKGACRCGDGTNLRFNCGLCAELEPWFQLWIHTTVVVAPRHRVVHTMWWRHRCVRLFVLVCVCGACLLPEGLWGVTCD